MTKERDTGSPERALLQAIGLLRADVAADAVGKSIAYLRRCSDPDEDGHHLRMSEAMALDRALIAAGHEPVMLTTYQAALRWTRPEPGDCVNAKNLRVIEAAGRVAKAIREGTCPNGDGGHHLTARECDAILDAAEECDRELTALIVKVKAEKARALAGRPHLAVAAE